MKSIALGEYILAIPARGGCICGDLANKLSISMVNSNHDRFDSAGYTSGETIKKIHCMRIQIMPPVPTPLIRIARSAGTDITGDNLPRRYPKILALLTPVLKMPPSRLKTERQKSRQCRSVPSSNGSEGRVG